MDNQTNLLPVGCLLQNGKYRVEQHLGSGGFGHSYRVVDTTSGKQFALKEFFLKGVNERNSDSQMVSVSNSDNRDEFELQKAKFRKESMRLQKLNNPHVVHVYEMFEEKGTAYYVMDFLEGESLSARMKRQGHPFSEAEVLDMTHQILTALATVHNENIWHLDLKPGNIMTAGDGRLVLIDFGASKQFHDADGHSLSTSTGLCYTPGYAPTEQIAGELSRMGPWTDLYALGATIYNLLTMEAPPTVSAIQDGEAFRFPDMLSNQTRRLIIWLMQPNRNQRPQSVAAVQQFLAPPAAEQTVVHTDDDEQTVVHIDDDEEEESGNNRTKWFVIGGIAAVAAVLALFLMTRNKDTDSVYVDDEDEEAEWVVMDDDNGYADDQAVPADTFMRRQDMPEERQQPTREEIREVQPVARQAEERRTEQPVPRPETQEDMPLAVVAETPQPTPPASDNKVYDVVEQQPQFPGGDAALMQYLSSHLQYPIIAAENGIQGRVVCKFVVEKDGSLSGVRVVQSVDPMLDKEAVRVVKSMPRWNPGKQNGEAVRVNYTVPVTFRLQ